MNNKGFSSLELLIALFVIFALVGIPLYAAFSDRSETVSFLEYQGYSDINLTGYEYFSCGHGDLFKDGFTALNTQGKPVNGVVCAGLFKGKTIRFH